MDIISVILYLVVPKFIWFFERQEDGAQVGPEAKLQLVLEGDLLVALQSTLEKDRCVGINEDGSLLPAKNVGCNDNHAKFGVLLFVSFQLK